MKKDRKRGRYGIEEYGLNESECREGREKKHWS
jgi:hypothetical protein